MVCVLKDERVKVRIEDCLRLHRQGEAAPCENSTSDTGQWQGNGRGLGVRERFVGHFRHCCCHWLARNEQGWRDGGCAECVEKEGGGPAEAPRAVGLPSPGVPILAKGAIGHRRVAHAIRTFTHGRVDELIHCSAQYRMANTMAQCRRLPGAGFDGRGCGTYWWCGASLRRRWLSRRRRARAAGANLCCTTWGPASRAGARSAPSTRQEWARHVAARSPASAVRAGGARGAATTMRRGRMRTC